jgi:hypothetical protein
MWLMLLTFISYRDPTALGSFSVEVESVAFSSQSACEAARSRYLAEIKPTVDLINAAIDEERQVGNLKGPNAVAVSIICVAQ